MGFRMGLGWVRMGLVDGLVMGNGEKKIADTHTLGGIRMWFVSFHACSKVQEGQKKGTADDPFGANSTCDVVGL